jgi:hypothetical protein
VNRDDRPRSDSRRDPERGHGLRRLLRGPGDSTAGPALFRVQRTNRRGRQPEQARQEGGGAYTESFADLLARSDASVYQAARNGGISTIRSIDYEFVNSLGLYSKFTVVVYGE